MDGNVHKAVQNQSTGFDSTPEEDLYRVETLRSLTLTLL